MMLLKLLNNMLPTTGMADAEPTDVRYWAYLLPHLLFGAVLGMLVWKTMNWLLH
jgi:hypothetical protein